MNHRVQLVPHNITFEVNEGETILEAALNNNISFPNRCQVGACAACLCRKLKGEVSYHLEPMLTENEQARGWLFACQAYPTTDLTLTFDE
ncbi:2Fe-2S iron-sulfur cluster-binding protein [Vibrio maerlii]|uniref:2Fe-2S iron-sulfur cluster-binding protein n=1 Tax=Vibrio maerlii TaxID=2231648 RepID=UPI000E3DEB0E|nr:2Fe-2S iron-sulfur cluster-binding protein [Vibrio maerlii]